MKNLKNCTSNPKHQGFTLIELMIVVAIIGILAAIAIPNFLRFQLKSKSTEANAIIASISNAENAYFKEYAEYVSTMAMPAGDPTPQKRAWQQNGYLGEGFARIGFMPDGPTYFDYSVSVSEDGTMFFILAEGDIDGDAVLQRWGYVGSDYTTTYARLMAFAEEHDCPIKPRIASPCQPEHGQSVF